MRLIALIYCICFCAGCHADFWDSVKESASKAGQFIKKTSSDTWSFVTARGNNQSEHVSDSQDDERPSERKEQAHKSIREIYEERKAVFEQQQREKKVLETKAKNENPTLVIFETKENATAAEEALKDIDRYIGDINEITNSFSKELEKLMSNAGTDTFETIQDSHRIAYLYALSAYFFRFIERSVRNILSGLAIVKSISSISDESYNTGIENIKLGLMDMRLENELSQNIRHFYATLQASKFLKFSPRIAELLTKFSEKISTLQTKYKEIPFNKYNDEICRKVHDNNIAILFSENLQNIININKYVQDFFNWPKILLTKIQSNDNQ